MHKPHDVIIPTYSSVAGLDSQTRCLNGSPYYFSAYQLVNPSSSIAPAVLIVLSEKIRNQRCPPQNTIYLT